MATMRHRPPSRTAQAASSNTCTCSNLSVPAPGPSNCAWKQWYPVPRPTANGPNPKPFVRRPVRDKPHMTWPVQRTMKCCSFCWPCPTQSARITAPTTAAPTPRSAAMLAPSPCNRPPAPAACTPATPTAAPTRSCNGAPRARWTGAGMRSPPPPPPTAAPLAGPCAPSSTTRPRRPSFF